MSLTNTTKQTPSTNGGNHNNKNNNNNNQKPQQQKPKPPQKTAGKQAPAAPSNQPGKIAAPLPAPKVPVEVPVPLTAQQRAEHRLKQVDEGELTPPYYGPALFPYESFREMITETRKRRDQVSVPDYVLWACPEIEHTTDVGSLKKECDAVVTQWTQLLARDNQHIVNGFVPAHRCGSQIPSLDALRGVQGFLKDLTTYGDRFKLYKVPVGRGAVEHEKALKELKIPYSVLDNGFSTFSHHPVSASVRKYLTAFSLNQLYQAAIDGNFRPDIVSAYGNDRDVATNEFLSGGKMQPGQKATVRLHRPRITAADFMRGDNTVARDFTTRLMLLVDIYMAETLPLTPEFFRIHLEDQGRAVWLGHCFQGAAGTTCGEGGWCRITVGGKDLILHRADKTLQASPLHDPCDWIWTDSVHEFKDGSQLSWNVKTHIGGTYVVEFLFEKVPHQIIRKTNMCVVAWQFAKVQVVEERKGWWGKILRFCLPSHALHMTTQYKRVRIHTPTFESMKLAFSGRRRDDSLLRTILKQASETFARTDGLLLSELFPTEFSGAAQSLAYAVFADVSAEAHTLAAFAEDHGELLHYHAQSLSVLKPENLSPGWTKTQIASSVLVAATVLLLARKIGIIRYSTLKAVVGAASMPDHCARLVANSVKTLASIPGAGIWNWFAEQVNGSGMSSEEYDVAVDVTQAILVAPFYEEIVKRCIPKEHRWLFGFIEWWYKIINFPNLPNAVQASAALCVHKVVENMSFLPSVTIHFAWNVLWLVGYWKGLISARTAGAGAGMLPSLKLLATLGWMGMSLRSRGVPYQEFREKFYVEDWRDRPEIDSLVIRNSDFPADLSVTPTQHMPYFKPKPLCQLLTVAGSIALPTEDNHSTYYWLLPTNVPGYVPQRSDEQLVGVINSRILVAPPLDPQLQLVGWSHLSPLVPACLPIVRENFIAEWLAHFEEAHKVSRYKAALSQREREGPGIIGPYLDRVDIMVKTDEVLVKCNLEGGLLYPSLKPRAIANVHPQIQVEVGPVIYEAMRRLKEAWSLDPYVVNVGTEERDLYAYITYGGALSDEELTQWADRVLVPAVDVIFLIVAGDDTLAVWYDRYGVCHIYEGDFGMFDQSESFGPLVFEGRALTALGVSSDIVTVMQRVATASYVAKTRNPGSKDRIVIGRRARPFRDTGGPNTTIGNSLVAAHAVLLAVQQLSEHSIPVEVTMKTLGLDYKYRLHDSFFQSTFLKGMWYRTETAKGYFWGPLPSRILKAGKCLKDPRKLYHRGITLEEASTRLLGEIACGYAFYLQVPVLRAFVKNFKREGLDPVKFSPWKIQAVRGPKPLLSDAAWEQMEVRYGYPRQVWLDLEATFPDKPFVFMEHPLFAAMALADYC